jgi:hypothetical protein
MAVIAVTIIGITGACDRSPSPPPDEQQTVSRFLDLDQEVRALDWDFHVALRRGDGAAARDAALAAARRLELILADLPNMDIPRCLTDAVVAIQPMLKAELDLWRSRERGDNQPTEDEISLFFAFYGAERNWAAVLRIAGRDCGPDIARYGGPPQLGAVPHTYGFA